MPKKIALEKVSLDLTRPQARRLSCGKTCQLKHTQMTGGSVHVMLSPAKARKLRTAHNKQRGVRLHLSEEEREMSGEGFKEFLAKIKRGYNKKVKPVVGPMIKKALTTAVKAGLPALAVASGQPELVIPAHYIADAISGPAVSKLGQITGAFGVRHSKHSSHRPKFSLQDNMSQLIAPDNPAFYPALPPPDFSTPQPIRKNRVSGGLIAKPGAKLSVSMGGRVGRMHPALTPALPPRDFSSGGSFRPSGGSFMPSGS